MRKLLLFIGVLCFAMTAMADETIGDFRFYFKDGKASVREFIAPDGFDGTVTIPAEVTSAESGTCPVVEIYREVFKNNEDITSVILSEGLTTIGANAFNGAKNLQTVQIPASVTEIYGGAFSGCTKLEKVTFGSIKSLCNISFEKYDSNPIYYTKGFYIGDEQINDLTVPGEAGRISRFAFYNCTSLTSLTIEEGVTTIGISAFSGCTSLTSVSIPSTVTQIGEDAFNITSNTLTKATFSSIAALCGIDFANVKSNPLYVAKHLYVGESEQTAVTLPSVGTIKPYVFAGASYLKSVIIPGEVKYIGTDAFLNCTAINTVSYSSSEQLTTMQYASNGVSNPLYYGATPVVEGLALGTLEFTKDISDNAFTNAKWLTEIKIGPNVTSIGGRAFYGCSNLSKITFSGTPTLQTIGQEAFRDCSALKEIDLPASLTTLGTLAFRSTNLETINIPAACTNIGTSVFEWCTQLTTVNFASSSSLTTIPNYIFNNCSNLTTVTLPNGLTAIGEGAFKNCSGLAAPPMSKSLTTIGKSAFDGCKGFTNLMLSETGQLSEIGEYAFNNCCNITMVSLPETIDIINNYAFSGCTSLEDIYILRETVPTKIYQYSFGGRESDIVLHVETDEAKTAYQDSNDIWKNFKEIVAKSNSTLTFFINEEEVSNVSGEAGKPFDHTGIPDHSGYSLFTGWWNNDGQIVEIPAVMPSGDMDFYGYIACEYTSGKFKYLLQPAETKNNRGLEARAIVIGHSLTQSDAAVDIPASVSYNNKVYAVDSIAPDIFVGAEMYSVSLPGAVKAIGSGAFKNCQNLQSVNIPTALTTISDHLFEGCTGLAAIEIPETVKKIGYQAFNNAGLTEITIPATITEMDNEAFKECKALKTAVFAEGFTLPVPKYTFWKCAKLQDVTLRGTMGVIGLNAFQECESLETIELPEGINFISAYAFAGCKNLNRITLPATMSMIGNQAFTGCTNLTQITVNRTGSTPAADMNAFDETTYNTAFLYVEDETLYQSADPWNKFTHIATQTEHNLVYKVNGADFKTVSLKAGSTITSETEPDGADYDNGTNFSGWIGLPEIMPAEDIVVNGNFQYEVKFYDTSVSETNRLLKDEKYAFYFGGAVVLPVEALNKSGFKYTLTGLTTESIFEDDAASVDITMPAHDIDVIVTYKPAEADVVNNGITYKVFMLENRAEVVSGSATATSVNIPETVSYDNMSYPVTVIQAGAFKGNNKLTSVTINNSIKVIGAEAFLSCKLLTTVTMPETLDSIGQQAFANTAITNVKVPYAPKMGKEIFYWCTKLSDISFSNSLTTLPERLFQGCLSLKEVTLPNQITAIGDHAFDGCTGIESFTLSENIQQLGDYAFWNVFGKDNELVLQGTTLPVAFENTFDEDAYKYALLKTSASTTDEPWKNFENVEGSSTEQCAKPTIEYAGGKLKFSCTTPGATIISKITIDDTGESSENEVVLSKNYRVTAYSKKDGMRRSETVTETFQFMNGDVDLDGEVDIADAVRIVNLVVGKIGALAPQFFYSLPEPQ